jgi:hypothetical protein
MLAIHRRDRMENIYGSKDFSEVYGPTPNGDREKGSKDAYIPKPYPDKDPGDPYKPPKNNDPRNSGCAIELSYNKN